VSVPGGISVHVIDVSRGVPAAGLVVEVWALDGERRRLARGALSARGTLDEPALAAAGPGRYEALFHVADFYRALGVALPDPPFLDVVPFRFAAADPAQHYHLPLKLTPWGFSLFRGG
jgi:5-hydroxyisourate hydrolase